jgi:diguanylate cyclase (GGDEF)-like protein
MMDSSEERGETPISAQRASDPLRPQARRTRQLLDTLDALLRTAHDPFAIVFNALRDMLAFDQAMVLAHTDESSIHCIAALPAEPVGRCWTAGDDRGLAGEPTQTTCCNHEPDGRWNLPRDLIAPAQPALYLPIGVRGRRGLLVLLRAAGDRAFDPAQVALGQEFALLASAALALRHAKEMETESRQLRGLADQLRQRAYFDELTGLAKGTLIQEHVEDVLARKGNDGRFAMAFIDLDNFKHINDYYSHAVGDALLVEVAARIAGRIRESDMLARISGDEFVLLVDPVESAQQVQAIVDQLLDALKQPFYIEGFEVFTSASIGVSIYPEHGHSYEALRRNADSAMYKAKSGGKGKVALFDRNMGQAVTARMELEQRLRLAIRDRQFRCAFQPKVDLRSQEVVGFEAHIRWCDERGTIQAPSDVVGLAIELGLIDPITQFMMTEAVNALQQLDEAFGSGTTMSVNVAAKQATDLKFMRSLAQALDETRLAHRIMIELTEDAFLAKGQFQMHVLPMLREIGVRVSIDDFGTGYSSLSALADITADEIKVDRSFITAIHQRPRSQSVLKMIESLSHSLGMTVVAEGVETFEELAYLQAATRIRYAQGFYFAKPFFLEDFSRTTRIATDGRPARMPRERAETRVALASRVVADARSR